MLMTIKTTLILIIAALGIVCCIFMIGHALGLSKATELTRRPVHAVDFYPVDPEVNSSLSMIRPYIEICAQEGGAWTWTIGEGGLIIGICMETSGAKDKDGTISGTSEENGYKNRPN